MNRIIISQLIFGFIFSTTSLCSLEPDYQAWNAILHKYVKPGSKRGIQVHLVDYTGIAHDQKWLQVQKDISTFDTKTLTTRSERLAFYINAYNIAAIRKVLEKNPADSIRETGDGVWKENAITLNGVNYSLDAIENKILRPLQEPRIHFAIVCASLSCPDLRAEAYTAAKLSRQLAAQTRSFLKNSTKGLRVQDKIIYHSSIFVWFATDFTDIDLFQRKYLTKLPVGAKRSELLYNWSLNRR